MVIHLREKKYFLQSRIEEIQIPAFNQKVKVPTIPSPRLKDNSLPGIDILNFQEND